MVLGESYIQPTSQPGGGSLKLSTHIARNSMCQKRDVKQCFFWGKFPYFCNMKNMISTHTKDFLETIGEETKKMGSKILMSFHPRGKIKRLQIKI
jgi:hypothetical protein